MRGIDGSLLDWARWSNHHNHHNHHTHNPPAPFITITALHPRPSWHVTPLVWHRCEKVGLWRRATRKVWFNKAAQRKTLHWLLSIFVCSERFPWPLLVLYSISIMTTWTISQPSPTFVVISHLRPHDTPCHSFYDHQTEYLSISVNGVYDEVRVWSGDNPGYHDIIPRTLQGPRDNLATPGQWRLCQIMCINVQSVAQINWIRFWWK